MVDFLSMLSVWLLYANAEATVGVSAFGFGGSLALLPSWNYTDSIILNGTDSFAFHRITE